MFRAQSMILGHGHQATHQIIGSSTFLFIPRPTREDFQCLLQQVSERISDVSKTESVLTVHLLAYLVVCNALLLYSMHRLYDDGYLRSLIDIVARLFDGSRNYLSGDLDSRLHYLEQTKFCPSYSRQSAKAPFQGHRVRT